MCDSRIADKTFVVSRIADEICVLSRIADETSMVRRIADKIWLSEEDILQSVAEVGKTIDTQCVWIFTKLAATELLRRIAGETCW